MTFKVRNLFFLAVIVFMALVGCERMQDMVVDTTPPAEPTMDDTMTGMAMEMMPVKLVWFIDYPEGGKDAYIAWVASIAPTLQAPEEVVRIRSYDNEDPEMLSLIHI